MTKEGMYRSTMVLEYEPKVMTNPTLNSTRNGYKNNNFLSSIYHMSGMVLPPWDGRMRSDWPLAWGGVCSMRRQGLNCLPMDDQESWASKGVIRALGGVERCLEDSCGLPRSSASCFRHCTEGSSHFPWFEDQKQAHSGIKRQEPYL